MRNRRSVIDYIAHLRDGKSVRQVALAACVTPSAIYSALSRAHVPIETVRPVQSTKLLRIGLREVVRSKRNQGRKRASQR